MKTKFQNAKEFIIPVLVGLPVICLMFGGFALILLHPNATLEVLFHAVFTVALIAAALVGLVMLVLMSGYIGIIILAGVVHLKERRIERRTRRSENH